MQKNWKSQGNSSVQKSGNHASNTWNHHKNGTLEDGTASFMYKPLHVDIGTQFPWKSFTTEPRFTNILSKCCPLVNCPHAASWLIHHIVAIVILPTCLDHRQINKHFYYCHNVGNSPGGGMWLICMLIFHFI